MKKSHLFTLLIICSSILFTSCNQSKPEYDIVIYGGTSAGVAAAVQAARMNKSVIIIEPGTPQQLGGLTSGGLGRTDYGNKHVIGGISREFYRKLHAHYLDEKNWKYQTREEYFKGQTYHPGSTNIEEQDMWFFEPSVARKVFQNWIDEYKIPVVYGERIVREGEGYTRLREDGRHVAEPGNEIGRASCRERVLVKV